MDAISIAAVLLVLLVVLRASAMLRSRRMRARVRRAKEGERSARALLAAHGYDVIAEQAAGAIVLRVDGAPSVHALRADYLVARGDVRFVAEVKTGSVAPSLDHAPTRRQIVEYCAAFDVDGALLVEPEAGRVREIRAPFVRRRASRWPWALVAVALAAVVFALVR